jgi:hypothetical protein
MAESDEGAAADEDQCLRSRVVGLKKASEGAQSLL